MEALGQHLGGAGVVEPLQLRLVLVLRRDFVGERAFHVRRGDRVFDQRGLGALRELLPRLLVELAGLSQRVLVLETTQRMFEIVAGAAVDRTGRKARPVEQHLRLHVRGLGGLARGLELGGVHVLHRESARRRDSRREAEDDRDNWKE